MTNLSDIFKDKINSMPVGSIFEFDLATEKKISINEAIFLREGFIETSEFSEKLQNYAHAGIWKKAYTPSTIPRNVETNGNTVIAVGDNGIVSRSVDNGETWTEKAVGTNRLRQASHSNGVWVAVGDGGVIYRSTDDADTWTLITDPANDTLLRISANNNNGTLIAVGINVIIRSTDNGLTFSPSYTIPTSGELWGIDTDSLGVWVGVSKTTTNNIHISSDDGSTWQTISAPTTNTEVSLGSIVYVGNGKWIISTTGDEYLISTDNGGTWKSYPLQVKGVSLPSNCYVFSNNNVVIIPADNGYFKSFDYGDSFEFFDMKDMSDSSEIGMRGGSVNDSNTYFFASIESGDNSVYKSDYGVGCLSSTEGNRFMRIK